MYPRTPFVPAWRLALALLAVGASTRPAAAQADPQFQIHLGPEETVVPPGQWGITHFPDGGISFARRGGEIDVWFACRGQTCHFRGPSFDDLEPARLTGGEFRSSLGPSGQGFDRNYAAAYSVLPAHGSSDLLMFYHAEEHPCGKGTPFHASIGLARSSDGGETWTRRGEILSTSAPRPAGCEFGTSGVRNPSVVVSPDGRYLYLYFGDRVPGKRDAIYLARSPVQADGAPGSWERYVDGRWAADGTAATPVISAPDPVVETVFAGQPRVSFNRALNRYLAVFQARDGFYVATSLDGVRWSAARPLLSGPSLTMRDLPAGTAWRHYATLISPQEADQTSTGATGYLYYALGNAERRPTHHLVRRSFAITLGPVLEASTIVRTSSALMGEEAVLPDSVELRFDGAGAGAARWSATNTSSWLSLHSTGGATAGSPLLRWTRRPSGLAAGTYVDTIVVADPRPGAAALLRIVDILEVREPRVSRACAIEELLGRPCLTDAERRYLDLMGNNDRAYNLGDLLSFLNGRAAPPAPDSR